MSKSKPKNYGHGDYDDNEYCDINRKSSIERRKEKQIRNLVRSKNVRGLMHIDDDDLFDEWEVRR